MTNPPRWDSALPEPSATAPSELRSVGSVSLARMSAGLEHRRPLFGCSLRNERAPRGGRKHSEVNGSFSGAAGAALGPGSSQSRCELGKDAFARLRVGALALFGELQTTGRESYHLSCRSLVLLRIRLRALLWFGGLRKRAPNCGMRLCVALLPRLLKLRPNRPK